jgi:hypothetical protein
MTFRRISLVAGIVVLTAFVYVVVAHGHDGGNALVIALALIVLIAAGNVLYGRNSHGAAAQARTGPAQEAHDRAIDEARRREADEARAEAQARADATTPAEDDAPHQ